MNDPTAEFIAMLLRMPDVVELFDSRIWAAGVPVAGYDPSQGPALCAMARGGMIDYSSSIFNVPVQVSVWARSTAEAAMTFGTLGSLINNHADQSVRMTVLEVSPIPTVDPSTGWSFVLGFFRSAIKC